MCWKAAERYVSLLTSENNPEDGDVSKYAQTQSSLLGQKEF